MASYFVLSSSMGELVDRLILLRVPQTLLAFFQLHLQLQVNSPHSHINRDSIDHGKNPIIYDLMSDQSHIFFNSENYQRVCIFCPFVLKLERHLWKNVQNIFLYIAWVLSVLWQNSSCTEFPRNPGSDVLYVASQKNKYMFTWTLVIARFFVSGALFSGDVIWKVFVIFGYLEYRFSSCGTFDAVNEERRISSLAKIIVPAAEKAEFYSIRLQTKWSPPDAPIVALLESVNSCR